MLSRARKLLRVKLDGTQAAIVAVLVLAAVALLVEWWQFLGAVP